MSFHCSLLDIQTEALISIYTLIFIVFIRVEYWQYCKAYYNTNLL